MKKPDWFELTDNDDRGLRVVNRIPYFVFVIITILVSAVVFLFPSYNSNKTPTPTAEVIIESPAATKPPSQQEKIKNPSIGVLPSSGDDEENEEEDEEEESDD
jgi:hypothetical protein